MKRKLTYLFKSLFTVIKYIQDKIDHLHLFWEGAVLGIEHRIITLTYISNEPFHFCFEAGSL